MIRKPHRALAVCIAAALSLACESRTSIRVAEASTGDSSRSVTRSERERARQDSIVRARPGYIVDSIRPIEEEIRRFQATLGERPSGFTNGAVTRSELVMKFVRAIEQNDTTGLTRLVVNRDEFGYLVYPSSPNAAPPYRQAPDLVWLMRSAGTGKASARLFARFGGRSIGFAGYSCPDGSINEGANTVWSGCVVRRAQSAGDTIALRMFGTIIERDGRFKFLSLSNGL